MRLLTVGLDDTFQFDYPTDKAVDDEDALSMLAVYEYDCCIADPLGSGEMFPHQVRQRKMDVPLIMLDPIHDVMLRVNLLSRGADRVLMVPIDKMELEAYIQALLRRCNGASLDNIITIGELTLQVDKGEVLINGESTHLTNREYQILEIMMRQPNRIFTKEAIVMGVYGGIDEPQLKIVDVFICKIRTKRLHMMSYNPISTIWGRGYRMAVPPEKEEAA